jgi:hypothetical protein
MQASRIGATVKASARNAQSLNKSAEQVLLQAVHH